MIQVGLVVTVRVITKRGKGMRLVMYHETQLASLAAIVRGVARNITMVTLEIVDQVKASLTAIAMSRLAMIRGGTVSRKTIAVPDTTILILTGWQVARLSLAWLVVVRTHHRGSFTQICCGSSFMSCFFFLEQEEKSEKIGDPIRTNIYVPSPDEATQWDFKVRTCFSASTFFKGISEEYFIVDSDKKYCWKDDTFEICGFAETRRNKED